MAAALHNRELKHLDDAVYHHLASCSRCRAALLVLVRSLEARGELPPTCTCTRCQNDLAAFIDAERINPMQAAQMYPEIWWHVLICSHCAATYEAVQLLVDAELGGQLSPLFETLRETPRQQRW